MLVQPMLMRSLCVKASGEKLLALLRMSHLRIECQQKVCCAPLAPVSTPMMVIGEQLKPKSWQRFTGGR